MITDEVEFNREEFIIARNSRELNRKEFCKKMNKKYGLNLGVHMASVDLDFPLDMAAEELDLIDKRDSREDGNNE